MLKESSTSEFLFILRQNNLIMKKLFFFAGLITLLSCNKTEPTVKSINNNSDTTYSVVAQLTNLLSTNYVNEKWKANATASISNGHLELDITGADTQKLSINIYDFKPAMYQCGGSQFVSLNTNNTAVFKPKSSTTTFNEDWESLPHDTCIISSLDTVQKTVSGSFELSLDNGQSNTYHFRGNFNKVKYTGKVPVLTQSFICKVGNANRLSDSGLTAGPNYNNTAFDIYSDCKDQSELHLSMPIITDIGTYNITEQGPYTSYFIRAPSSSTFNMEYYGTSGTITITLHTLSCIQGSYKTTLAGLDDASYTKVIQGSFTVLY